MKSDILLEDNYILIDNVHLIISPNLEKMSSRSSLVVTGLSLQTKSTLSSGRISASGISPISSRISAFAFSSERVDSFFRSSSLRSTNTQIERIYKQTTKQQNMNLRLKNSNDLPFLFWISSPMPMNRTSSADDRSSRGAAREWVQARGCVAGRRF